MNSSFRLRPLRFFALLLFGSLLPGCVAPAVDPARLAAAVRIGICPVHDVRMTKDRVRITYGLVAGPTAAASAAQRARFPFAHREVLGGCVVLTVVDDSGKPIPEQSSPETAEISVCGRCDAAKENWSHRHPKDRTARFWLGRPLNPERNTAHE